MILRQIQEHNHRVLVVHKPVAGESVESLLITARRHYSRLFERIMVALAEHTPVSGPPWDVKGDGVASAKELYDGLSEFVAHNREAARRKRARQSEDEKRLGLRIFFFEYGKDVICTNGCLKTTVTPEDALPAAFLVRQSYLDYLKSGHEPIIEGLGGG